MEAIFGPGEKAILWERAASRSFDFPRGPSKHLFLKDLSPWWFYLHLVAEVS